MNFIFILSGFVILVLGGNWLLKSAVSLSLRLDIPKIIIGMTVVSFATSAPELIVSLKAAMEDHPDIALGNVIGSNIANLGFVLAIVLMVGTIKVERSFYITDWPVMMLASVMLYLFLAFDGELQRWEGFVLFLTLVLVLIYLFKFQKVAVIEEMPEDEVILTLGKTFFYLLIGGASLWAGSELLIEGAVNIATDYGVSKRVIGITIISVGTSIPELAASLVAMLRKEKAISLGNLLGSNVFNILAVLGITSMIRPLRVNDERLISFDLVWMLFFALIIFPLVFAPGRMKLSWPEGLILLGAYIIFIALVF
jgi:cation:H+ antiporter